MLRADLVVAVGRDQQNGCLIEPAAEVAEEVERRLVRPVDVLDDCDCRSRAELLESCRKDLPPAKCPVEARRELVERGERLGREQPVARRPDDPRLPGLLLSECADEGGLPDAGLAADEHEASMARSCRAEVLAESREVRAPLDQLHAQIVRRSTSAE